MANTVVTDFPIGATSFRFTQSADGYLLRRLSHNECQEPTQLRRWYFAASEAAQAAARFVDEVLAVGEGEATRLRAIAQQAARRAYAARERMRAQAAAVRLLEQDCVAKTETYLARGRDLARACADVYRLVADLGLPVPERSLPLWINQVLGDTTSDSG